MAALSAPAQEVNCPDVTYSVVAVNGDSLPGIGSNVVLTNASTFPCITDDDSTDFEVAFRTSWAVSGAGKTGVLKGSSTTDLGIVVEANQAYGGKTISNISDKCALSGQYATSTRAAAREPR